MDKTLPLACNVEGMYRYRAGITDFWKEQTCIRSINAEPKCADARNIEAAVANFMLLNAVRSYPPWCLGEYPNWSCSSGQGNRNNGQEAWRWQFFFFQYVHGHKCRKEPRQAEEIYMHRYTDGLLMGGHLTTQTVELEFIKRRIKYSLVSAVAEIKYILVCYEWHSHFALSLLRAAQSL